MTTRGIPGDGASLHDSPVVKYAGLRAPNRVTTVLRLHQNNKFTHLVPRDDLWHHAAQYDWGLADAGASRLALAILADAVGDDLAMAHYRSFTFAVVARLKKDKWNVGRDWVVAWVDNQTKGG